VKSQVLDNQSTSKTAEQTMHQLPRTFLLVAGGTFLSLHIAEKLLTKTMKLHTFMQFAGQQGKYCGWPRKHIESVHSGEDGHVEISAQTFSTVYSGIYDRRSLAGTVLSFEGSNSNDQKGGTIQYQSA
jgi:hypothetical protein